MWWEPVVQGEPPVVVHFLANWVQRCSRLSSSVWRPEGQSVSVRSVCAAQDDTASPSLDSFNLLSSVDVNSDMPHRTGILNNRAHIPNVHRYQIPHRYSKTLQTTKHVQSATAFWFMLLTCKSQQRSDCTVRRRSLVSFTTSSLVPAMWRSLHLVGLSLRWFLLAQVSRSCTTASTLVVMVGKTDHRKA